MRLCLVPLVVAAAACSGQPPNGQPVDQAGGITVQAGGALARHDALVTLQPEPSPSASGRQRRLLGHSSSQLPYDIYYVAQCLPVTVNGQVLEADAIAISGNRAYVGYNLAGDPFGGAIQILDISTPGQPTILQQIQLADLDVDCLYVDGSSLLFGGSANPDKYSYRAFIGKVDLADVSASAILASLKGLRSYATTAVTRSNGALVAAVGAASGGFEMLDDSFNETSFVARADVRDMVAGNSAIEAVGGGADGGSGPALIQDSAGTLSEVTLGSSLTNYAKATIELSSDGSLAYLGLSNLGLQVLDLSKGNKTVFSLANPSTSVAAPTNAVSTSGDLAFVANGEYGFRVVHVVDTNGKDDKFGYVAGYHTVAGDMYGGQQLSVNHLKYQSGVLFAAVGAGGVNVYTVTASASASPSPSATATPTPATSAMPTPSASATATASSSATSAASASPLTSPSPSPTATPTPTPSAGNNGNGKGKSGG